MFKKTLSCVLIAAILANTALICMGHSHGPGHSGGDRRHVHLFGHDHAHHDHAHHDHGHHDHSHHDPGNHDSVHDEAFDRPVHSGKDFDSQIRHHSSGNHGDVLHLADFEWASPKEEEEDNVEVHTSAVAVFFHALDATPSPLACGFCKPPNASAVAHAHFLKSVRLLL